MSEVYRPQEYLPTIDAILGVADLEKITVKKIRNALQELFAINLDPHKQNINDVIMERYYLLLDRRKNEEKSLKEKREEMEAQDAIMAARLLKTPYNSPLTRSGGKPASKIKKPAAKKKSANGAQHVNNPFNKPQALSSELADVVECTQTSRPQVVKLLWAYIKERDLQDPKDKRIIVCDEKLRKLFKKKTVGAFEMNKILSNHIFPLDDGAADKRAKKAKEVDPEEIKKLYAGKTIKPPKKSKNPKIKSEEVVNSDDDEDEDERVEEEDEEEVYGDLPSESEESEA